MVEWVIHKGCMYRWEIMVWEMVSLLFTCSGMKWMVKRTLWRTVLSCASNLGMNEWMNEWNDFTIEWVKENELFVLQTHRRAMHGVQIQFLAGDTRDKSGKYLDWNLAGRARMTCQSTIVASWTDFGQWQRNICSVWKCSSSLSLRRHALQKEETQEKTHPEIGSVRAAWMWCGLRVGVSSFFVFR